MPDSLALLFLLLGFAFSLFGLFLGGKAFVFTWREFGDGPLWPSVKRWREAMAARARLLNPLRKRTSQALQVDDAFHAHASASVGTLRQVRWPLDCGDPDVVSKLIAVVEWLDRHVAEENGITRSDIGGLKAELHDARSEVATEAYRLEQLSKRVAVADIQIQLLSLVAIGIGTVVSAVPGVWNVMASLL